MQRPWCGCQQSCIAEVRECGAASHVPEVYDTFAGVDAGPGADHADAKGGEEAADVFTHPPSGGGEQEGAEGDDDLVHGGW